LYKPNIAILTGIAWDHINVFPTFENYVEQFKIFVDLIEEGGSIVYCESDSNVKDVSLASTNKIKKIPYAVPTYSIDNGITSLIKEKRKIELEVFGEHNLMNLEGARLVCNELKISDDQFYNAIRSFKGAARRLELVKRNNNTAFYKDFAHSPSKLKATTAAMKQQYSNRQLVACMELHTFSSLNEEFLAQYKGSMENADEAYVYFNPHTIEHKKLKPISIEQVSKAFGGNNIKVFTDSAELKQLLQKESWSNKNLLMMTSGNFDGIDFKELADKIIKL